MVKRLCDPLLTRSFFLFGARATGKSTLIKQLQNFNDSFYVDLLDDDVLNSFSREPRRLELLAGKADWIFIDEIQKSPKLLNFVHQLIEKKRTKFVLTGSSARKLKRGSANLLGGRANVFHLFPLTALELGEEFNLQQALQFGTLPGLYMLPNEVEKTEALKAYFYTFIKEEIQMEQVVRRLDPFRDFLFIAGQMSGKILNAHKIAKEVGVDDKTVWSYLQILQDTLIATVVPAFHRSIRKSQQQPIKFYLFDLGVQNFLTDLLSVNPKPGTSHFGHLFENFIILEIIRHNEYSRKDFRLSYYRTQGGVEVDIILTKARRDILVEIKSKSKIDFDEVRSLARNTADFGKAALRYYISQDSQEGESDGVRCLHWQSFLKDVFYKE